MGRTSSGGFACQHGEHECLHNFVLGCASRHLPTTDAFVAFATCAETHLKANSSIQPSDVISKCLFFEATKMAISRCFEGGKGHEAMKLFDKLGTETEALQKKICSLDRRQRKPLKR